MIVTTVGSSCSATEVTLHEEPVAAVVVVVVALELLFDAFAMIAPAAPAAIRITAAASHLRA